MRKYRKTARSEESLLMNGEDFIQKEDGLYVEEPACVDRSIRFTLCSEQMPEKSGNYICITKNGSVMDMCYAKKYNAFNAYDYMEDANSRIIVVAWAEVPAWVSEVTK